eukprot:14510541-Alexandrium_andersonii.AAC.1
MRHRRLPHLRQAHALRTTFVARQLRASPGGCAQRASVPALAHGPHEGGLLDHHHPGPEASAQGLVELLPSGPDVGHQGPSLHHPSGAE